MFADELYDFPDLLGSFDRPVDIHDAGQVWPVLNNPRNNTSDYANSSGRSELEIHNGRNRTLLLGGGLIH